MLQENELNKLLEIVPEEGLGQAAAAVGAPPQRLKKRRTNREELLGWTFSCIPILGFAIFGMIPLIFSLIISFNQYTGLRMDTAVGVGFENFATVFGDHLFWKSVLNTLEVIVATLIALVISVVISTLMNNVKHCKKLYQTVFFIPYVCSMVAITFMWQWIFNYNYGILNSILRMIGAIEENVNWLGSEDTFMSCMFVILIWGGTGFNIILLSAALTNVNKTYYEAADIDGAGVFIKFFKITLPAISPTIFYLLITGLIGALQEFTRFQVMASDGGPNYAGLTIVFYLYRQLFNAQGGSNIGVATAVGWILAVFIALITALNFWISKKWVSYGE